MFITEILGLPDCQRLLIIIDHDELQDAKQKVDIEN